MADNGYFINYVLSMLLKKIIVPGDYHGQVKVVKEMLVDDMTGLVDCLTDFAVTNATVDYNVETDNSEFTIKLKNWLENINANYGTVPRGIRALAKEYFKERWKSSSFPVLKVKEWVDTGSIIIPSKMFFVDGESIYAKDTDDSQINSINGYEYYLGQEQNAEKLDTKKCILTKPFGRWFDEYATPYLIKRGIYHNYQIIKSLKDKQTTILDQVIPYLLLIKKGTEGLATNNIKTYSDEELKAVIQQFQELMDTLKSTDLTEKQIKSPIRATQFDEDIKHLIPDLSTIFNRDLFTVAEKNIIAGLGFIDVVEAVSTSRRESILNPKAFMEEVRNGVEDFKNDILHELIARIKEKNTAHPKYMKSDFYVTSSPIKGFMTDDFKELIRSLYDRGRISSQTAVEIIGEVDFKTEIYRREKEAKEGIDIIMYPPVKENREGQGADLPQDLGNPPKKDEDEIPEDKKGIEADNYDMAMGETLELEEIEDLYNSAEPRITDKYIRFRQIDPKKFQKNSFRIITLSESKGIKAIIGRLTGQTSTTIQSYLFDKTKWEIKEAENWIEKNKSEDILETAPYNTISELPDYIRKKSRKIQLKWMKIFNNAYSYMLGKTGNTKKAESYAFRVANTKIKGE